MWVIFFWGSSTPFHCNFQAEPVVKRFRKCTLPSLTGNLSHLSSYWEWNMKWFWRVLSSLIFSASRFSTWLRLPLPPQVAASVFFSLRDAHLAAQAQSRLKFSASGSGRPPWHGKLGTPSKQVGSYHYILYRHKFTDWNKPQLFWEHTKSCHILTKRSTIMSMKTPRDFSLLRSWETGCNCVATYLGINKTKHIVILHCSRTFVLEEPVRPVL